MPRLPFDSLLDELLVSIWIRSLEPSPVAVDVTEPASCHDVTEFRSSAVATRDEMFRSAMKAVGLLAGNAEVFGEFGCVLAPHWKAAIEALLVLCCRLPLSVGANSCVGHARPLRLEIWEGVSAVPDGRCAKRYEAVNARWLPNKSGAALRAPPPAPGHPSLAHVGRWR